MEAPFQGRVHEYANTFANVSRYLTERGFVLYDFDSFRYSRAALPQPFLYDIPAQTTRGQMYLSDALYFRDLAHPEYGDYWKYEVTRERVLKLVALFDLFELQDCAAELLLARPALTSPERAISVDTWDSRRSIGRPARFGGSFHRSRACGTARRDSRRSVETNPRRRHTGVWYDSPVT